jgi:hypothetical protein
MIYYLLEFMAGAYCVFEKTKSKTPNLCEAKCVLFCKIEEIGQCTNAAQVWVQELISPPHTLPVFLNN